MPRRPRTPVSPSPEPADCQRAFELVNSILHQNPHLYKLCNHHLGVVGLHAELWCATSLGLLLPRTGVHPGLDAKATISSPPPLRPGDRTQVKVLERESMHVIFMPRDIDWLCIRIYASRSDPGKVRTYLVNAPKLVELAKAFNGQHGRAVHPVRESDCVVRLEWGDFYGKRQGMVKGKNQADTWEGRYERCRQILGFTYEWIEGRFVPVQMEAAGGPLGIAPGD